MDVFCSTVIPTTGRPSLERAVLSVLNQRFDVADLEVIVVNDSGRPLPHAGWHDCDRVRIVSTMRRERSVARNTGAAMARGRYLHFLDDDDIILPGALDAFWTLYQDTRSGWLYGAYQTVDNEGNLVEVIRPGIVGDIFALFVVGESIPFQTSLLDADLFHAVGAFDPSPQFVGVEDRDVGRRMGFGCTVAYTPLVIAQIRIGEEGSTTDWAVLAERDRLGREKSLQLEGTRRRLRSSVASSFLCGRVSRAYIASAAWNLRRRNYLMFVSRVLAALEFAGTSAFFKEYWRGLCTRIR